MSLLFVAECTGILLVFLTLYVYRNDKALLFIPPDILALSPERCTPKDVRATADRIASSPPISKNEILPPKTGRRYIVVGGGGFLGGWIVTKLLQRGEAPDHIRLMDIRPPTNDIVREALSRGAQFIQVDVTDAVALKAAFKAAWPIASTPKGQPEPEITVFHTVASIRFYERHPEFLERSSKVNVEGTKNIIDASRAAGATVLIYTSSASVGVHNCRILLWPWEKEPKKFRQIINDDENRLPKRREDFFSNYAVTKIQGDIIVRASDKTSTGSRGTTKVMRTGCIRPGNAIFGPRGDLVCDIYTTRGHNESWVQPVVQSFSYVENCATAHLCYEARLVELLKGGKNPDIGGQAFCITDPGPAPTFGDFYNTMETLTDGKCSFSQLSPTTMLFIAHAMESYIRLQYALTTNLGAWIGKVLPPVTGLIINLQPSLFALTSVHVIIDDSRARLPPEQGGLGYTGAWPTLEGVHQTMEEHHRILKRLQEST